MSATLDAIVDRIDSGDLKARTHAVVGVLAEHLKTLSPLASEVVAVFEHGHAAGSAELLARLWREINSLPLEKQGGRRMLVALLQPDRQLDGHEAGYYLLWSERESLPEIEVSRAFESQ